VFFKPQLIAFFEGVRSERQLMETVNLNLAHHWFIGYDLDEPIPDHSGWGGACSGMGDCQFNMDGDKTVTATFIEIPKTLLKLFLPMSLR
jgi:hypothetical protein